MKRLAGLALLTFASACTAPSPVGERAQGIINGTTDSGDPAVVLVLAQTSATMGALCTGEIVSPHVVLTAAHCVDPDVLMTTTATFTVFTGAMLSQSSPKSDFLSVKETHYDTAFNMGAAENGHDVGVVILNNPAPITPIPYNRTPATQSMVGQPARFVGYGVTSGTDTMATTAGTRRTTTTTVFDVMSSANLIGFQDGQHGICEGDSGGPAFMTINGKELIVGITSFGFNQPSNCTLTSPAAGFGAGNDTDVGAYTDFIDKYVTMFDPPAKGPGDQCSTDADCAPRLCEQTSVGKICVQNCDPAANPSTCPAGTQCTNVDGQNLCYTTMAGGGSGGGGGGGKSGGCDVSGRAPVGGIGLLLGCVLLLSLRRRTRS